MINSTENQDDVLNDKTEIPAEETKQSDTETKGRSSKEENPVKGKKGKNKFLTYVKTHKAVVVLLVVLVVFAVWAFIRMAIMNNRFDKQQTELVQNYEQRIDSINAVNLQTTSEVFAWAIRSELIRQNQDQVNQYFLTFVHQPNVLKISYVDNTTSKILISTDKKEEGSESAGVDITTDSTFIQVKETDFNVVTPVMGLNRRLGTLIIDYKKQ